MAAQRDLTQKNRRHGHLAECKSLREERPRVGMRASGEDYRLSSARANTLSRICRSLRAQFVFARRRHISLTSGRLAKEADARNKALVSATYTETPPFDSRGWGCGRGQRGCGGVCGGGAISAPSLAEMQRRFRRTDKDVSPSQPPSRGSGQRERRTAWRCLCIMSAPPANPAED